MHVDALASARPRGADRLERVVGREAELRAVVAGADRSCVSASTPGVTRMSVRATPASARAPAPRASRRDERAGLGRGAELLVATCCCRARPGGRRRSRRAARTRARRASRRRRRRPPRRAAAAARRSGTPSSRRRRARRARRRGRRARSRAASPRSRRRAGSRALGELGRGEPAELEHAAVDPAPVGKSSSTEQVRDGHELVAVSAKALHDRGQRCDRGVSRDGRVLSIAVVQADDRAGMRLGEGASSDRVLLRTVLPVEARPRSRARPDRARAWRPRARCGPRRLRRRPARAAAARRAPVRARRRRRSAHATASRAPACA